MHNIIIWSYSRAKTSGTNRRTCYQRHSDECRRSRRRRRRDRKFRPVISANGQAAAAAAAVAGEAVAAAAVVEARAGDAAGADDGDSGAAVAAGDDPSRKGPSWRRWLRNITYIDLRSICGLSHFSTARRGTFVCNLYHTRVGRRASGGGGGGSSVVVGCTRLGHRAHARTHVLDVLYYTYYDITAKMYLFIFIFGGEGRGF